MTSLDRGPAWPPGARPAACILAGAMFFNAALAIVNAHVVPLQSAAVVACEALLLVAAHAVIAARARPQMLPWYLLLLPIVLFGLLRASALGTLEAKYVRDLALIPTFFLLGLVFPREKLGSLLVAIHAAVLAGLLLEWASLDGYANLFAIKDYYIRTRGTSEEGFWNTSSTLFVSATRPDDRFFSFVGWHRMSSIFLEPVSLGNYCVVIAACVCAFPAALRRGQLLFLAAGTALMLIGCDGRLATVTIAAIAAISVVAPRLPPNASLLFPPLTVLAAFAVVMGLDLEAAGDNFAGRIAHTVDLLGRLSSSDYMGMSNAFLQVAVDSGVTYLIITQSIVLPVLVWGTVALLADEHDPAAVRYKTAVAIYISFSLLISFSFLSIKTAAPLWFVLGALQPVRKGVLRRAAAPPAAHAPLRRSVPC